MMTATASDPDLHGRRVGLEPVCLAHAGFFLRLVNTPGWLRYIGDRRVASVADAERFLRNELLVNQPVEGVGYFVIRMADTATPIGACGCMRKPWLDFPDFGFALLPEFEGQGLAAEAARLALALAAEHPELATLDAVTLPENQPSIRLLARLGFSPNGSVSSPFGELLRTFRWHAAGDSRDKQKGT